MTLDPTQAAMYMDMMSRAGGGSGMNMGMPGAPPGIGMLAATSSQYSSPRGGNYMPHPSALGPLTDTFSSFGSVGGGIASMLVDMQLRNQFAQDGLIPLGNAGSFWQAQQVERNFQMQQTLGPALRDVNRPAVEATLNAAMNLAGQPFDTLNPEQQQQFRDLSGMLATAGSYVGATAGGAQVMDSLMGGRGDVLAMAAQMQHSDRYRIDPYTGQMGYSGETQARMTNAVFRQMYENDNTAEILGVRAGAMGNLYTYLSDEGLLPSEDLTREQLRSYRAQAFNDLDNEKRQKVVADVEKATGKSYFLPSHTPGSAGVRPDDDVFETSMQHELIAPGVADRLIAGKTDVLKKYTESIAAIGELFGDNGRPNAPIPELMNALKALTGNRLQQIDPAQLTSMVGDIQAVTRVTGLSVDQVFQANQTARHLLAANNAGPHTAGFEHDVAMQGIAVGQSVKRGQWTGYGIQNEEQARYAAMNIASRAYGSQMAANLAVLSRVNSANPELLSADARSMADAAGRGERTYVNSAGEQVEIPMKDADFTSFLSQQKMGLDLDTFHRLRQNKTFVGETLHNNPELAAAVLKSQAPELRDKMIADAQSLTGLRNSKYGKQSAAIVTSVYEAVDSLGNKVTDTKLRDKTVQDALKKFGMSDQEAAEYGLDVYSSMERTVQSGLGSSFTLANYMQQFGTDSLEKQSRFANSIELSKQISEASRPLGVVGDGLNRFITALQKTGGDKDANISTVLEEWLAVDNAGSGLTAEQQEGVKAKMTGLATRYNELESLRMKIYEKKMDGGDTTDLNNEFQSKLSEYEKEVLAVKGDETVSGLAKKRELARAAKEISSMLPEADKVEPTTTEGGSVNIKFPEQLKITGTLRISKDGTTASVTEANLSGFPQ
jgi:hypothetical protein